MTIEGRLSHVEVNVSDLAAACAFYEWFFAELGYSLYQHWDQGRSWKLGETYVVVVQVDAAHAQPPFHRRRAGLNHLAFHAASPERVDWMKQQLVQRGATVLYESPRAGSTPYALYFEGPDRLKIEYVWDPASTT